MHARCHVCRVGQRCPASVTLSWCGHSGVNAAFCTLFNGSDGIHLAYAAYFGSFPGLRRPADDLRAAFRPCPNFDGHDRLDCPAGVTSAGRKSRRGKLLLSNERPRIEVGSSVSCGPSQLFFSPVPRARPASPLPARHRFAERRTLRGLSLGLP